MPQGIGRKGKTPQAFSPSMISATLPLSLPLSLSLSPTDLGPVAFLNLYEYENCTTFYETHSTPYRQQPVFLISGIAVCKSSATRRFLWLHQHFHSHSHSSYLTLFSFHHLIKTQKVGKEFFHDPNLGSADSGKVQKKMTWTPTADKKGMSRLA